VITALVWLVACDRDTGPDTGPTLETGWFTDTDDWRCADRVMSTTPSAGTSDWYWRDALVAHTGTRDATAYDAWIVDADGVPVEATAEWVADRPDLVVTPAAPLRPSSTYSLVVEDCEGQQFVPFGTSALGEPLVGGPGSLIDATFAIRLQDAAWDEPAGLGGLIALYLDWPVLLGVQFANAQIVDLIGAQAYLDPTGKPRQMASTPTWDYPLANFEQSPYLDTTAPEIRIAASSSVVLPVYDFRLRTTFAADGSAIGGARVSGLGDTRGLGPALDMGEDEGAVCNAAIAFGVSCVPCPDDAPYCLKIDARNVNGERVDGVVVVPVQ
jgi:hypothetical protein